jgi:hypothetical protein
MYLDKKGIQVFNIKHFYDLFDKKPKLNYFIELGKNAQSRSISFKLYKKIIGTFFEIYFKEVFYLNSSYYFPVGGKAVRAKNRERINDQGIHIPQNLSLVWYLRPRSTRKKISFSFLRGRTIIIWNLIQEVKKNINLDEVEDYKEKSTFYIKNNSFYNE